jgi:hypothetical protein
LNRLLRSCHLSIIDLLVIQKNFYGFIKIQQFVIQKQSQRSFTSTL